MAQRAKSGGVSTGVGAALVILALAFVTATTFAVVFYLKIEENRQAAERATADLARAIDLNRSPREVVALWERSKVTASEPLAGRLHEELRASRLLAAGEADMSRADIETAVTSLTFRPSLDPDSPEQQFASDGRSMLQDARTVIQVADALRDQLASATQDVAELTRQLASETRAGQERTNRFNTAIDDLNRQLTQFQSEAAQRRDAWGTESRQIQETISRIQSQFNAFRNRIQEAEYSVDVENIQRNLNQARAEIINLQQQLTVRRAVPDVEPVFAPDGRIISLMPRERDTRLAVGDLVEIDLGSVDQLLLGMQFSVFPQRFENGISHTTPRKASIEVIRLREKNAVARVAQLFTNEPIAVNDVIFNQVFDRERTMRFLVVGRFDLDNRGTPSTADRRRIESLIENWGGIVVDEPTAQVDFVILGVPPIRPEQPDIDTGFGLSEEERRRQSLELQEFERINAEIAEFEQLEGRARELNLTIRNLNQFLNMIGFYRRG